MSVNPMRDWLEKLAPEQRAELTEHLARIENQLADRKPKGRPRVSAEEQRRRKTERQRQRREGERIAKHHEQAEAI
jgi:hypothetical protein